MANQVLVLKIGNQDMGELIDALTNAVENYRDNLVERAFESDVVNEMVIAFHDRLIANALTVRDSRSSYENAVYVSWEDEREE